MKISLKELRKLINEELVAINARSGERMPILGSNVAKIARPEILGKAMQIVFDFENDEDFFKLLSKLESEDKTKQKSSLEIPGVPHGWGKTPNIPKRLPLPPAETKAPGRRR